MAALLTFFSPLFFYTGNNAVDKAARTEEKLAAGQLKEQKQLSYQEQKRRAQAPKRIEKIEKELAALEQAKTSSKD